MNFAVSVMVFCNISSEEQKQTSGIWRLFTKTFHFHLLVLGITSLFQFYRICLLNQIVLKSGRADHRECFVDDKCRSRLV